jgi:hypothetical protein
MCWAGWEAAAVAEGGGGGGVVPTEHAGFYQIRFANGRDALIAVNPDPRESDLEPIPDDVLKLWSGAAGGAAKRVAAGRRKEERMCRGYGGGLCSYIDGGAG